MKAFKKVIFFIIFEIIFCSIFGIYLVFYGPFTNIKEAFVTSAMTTMNHKYLASIFLNNKEIEKIMAKNQMGALKEKENENDIRVNKKDNEMELIDINTNKFQGYLLKVDNPSRVKVGTSENLGEGGMPLSKIAEKYGASGGINAGGFSDNKMTGNGGTPTGLIIEDHEIKYNEKLKKYPLVGFNDKNVLIIGDYTLDEIETMDIRDAISFSPPLIINGKKMIKNGDGGWGIAPRTAIGQTKDGAVLMLVVDGRSTDSLGATLKDLQDILYDYGAYNAVNLDGGSSATMNYCGKTVNKPSDILGERAIPSAFIVK